MTEYYHDFSKLDFISSITGQGSMYFDTDFSNTIYILNQTLTTTFWVNGMYLEFPSWTGWPHSLVIRGNEKEIISVKLILEGLNWNWTVPGHTELSLIRKKFI